MKVLVLGIMPSPLTPILASNGCRVVEFAEPIDVAFLKDQGIEFAVSYRYRHIVKKRVIEYLQGRIINLHISLLPWNRGADPNLWSFLEDTPKGVTIHCIDEGLDTGDILAQKEVVFATTGETLATTYEKLNAEVIDLFRQEWSLLARGGVTPRKQPPGGSLHFARDKERFKDLLAEKGWKTPVDKLIGKALSDSRR